MRVTIGIFCFIFFVSLLSIIDLRQDDSVIRYHLVDRKRIERLDELHADRIEKLHAYDLAKAIDPDNYLRLIKTKEDYIDADEAYNEFLENERPFKGYIWVKIFWHGNVLTLLISALLVLVLTGVRVHDYYALYRHMRDWCYLSKHQKWYRALALEECSAIVPYSEDVFNLFNSMTVRVPASSKKNVEEVTDFRTNETKGSLEHYVRMLKKMENTTSLFGCMSVEYYKSRQTLLALLRTYKDPNIKLSADIQKEYVDLCEKVLPKVVELFVKYEELCQREVQTRKTVHLRRSLKVSFERFSEYLTELKALVYDVKDDEIEKTLETVEENLRTDDEVE